MSQCLSFWHYRVFTCSHVVYRVFTCSHVVYHKAIDCFKCTVAIMTDIALESLQNEAVDGFLCTGDILAQVAPAPIVLAPRLLLEEPTLSKVYALSDLLLTEADIIDLKERLEESMAETENESEKRVQLYKVLKYAYNRKYHLVERTGNTMLLIECLLSLIFDEHNEVFSAMTKKAKTSLVVAVDTEESLFAKKPAKRQKVLKDHESSKLLSLFMNLSPILNTHRPVEFASFSRGDSAAFRASVTKDEKVEAYRLHFNGLTALRIRAQTVKAKGDSGPARVCCVHEEDDDILQKLIKEALNAPTLNMYPTSIGQVSTPIVMKCTDGQSMTQVTLAETDDFLFVFADNVMIAREVDKDGLGKHKVKIYPKYGVHFLFNRSARNYA